LLPEKPPANAGLVADAIQIPRDAGLPAAPRGPKAHKRAAHCPGQAMTKFPSPLETRAELKVVLAPQGERLSAGVKAIVPAAPWR